MHDLEDALLHCIRSTNGIAMLECRADDEIPENRVLHREWRKRLAKGGNHSSENAIEKPPPKHNEACQSQADGRICALSGEQTENKHIEQPLNHGMRYPG